jgi:hypothetical protein
MNRDVKQAKPNSKESQMLDRDLEPDYDYDCACSECDVHETKLEQAGRLVRNILKHLYVKGVFDNVELEFLLDDLCGVLKVDIIPGDMQVQAREPQAKIHKETNVLSAWIEQNNKFLKSLSTI